MNNDQDLGEDAHGPITFDDCRDPKNIAAIRNLNDHFRTTFTGGRVLMTAGVAALAEETTAQVLTAVRTFTAFTRDNDPPDYPDGSARDDPRGYPPLGHPDEGHGPRPGLKNGIPKASGLWRRFGGSASKATEEPSG